MIYKLAFRTHKRNSESLLGDECVIGNSDLGRAGRRGERERSGGDVQW
jgi:hypothetical protein